MEPIELECLTFYPLGIAVALLFIPFFIATTRAFQNKGMKRETASIFAVLAIPLCYVLARLGYCLMILDQLIGNDDFGMIFRVGEGGFLLWGAIGGVLLAVWFTARITRQSTAQIADSVVVPTCLMIAALRLLCGLMFSENGIGFKLDSWFDPEETDYAYRYSLWMLEDYSFFERLPFAVENYYGKWCWAIFVPETIWACIMALVISRCKREAGAKTTLFLILYSCAQIVLEAMHRGQVIYLPWQGFVRANQVLCIIALVIVICVCLKRLAREERWKTAVVCFAQVIAAALIVVAMEFAAFEKKITIIETWPADVCHLIEIVACLWMGLAANRLRKKAFALHSADALVES